MNQQNDPKKVQALRKAVRAANDVHRKKPTSLTKEWGIGDRILEEYNDRLADSPSQENVLEACGLLNALWNTRIYPGNVAKWAKILTKFLNKDWKELSRKSAAEKRRYVAKELMLEGLNREEKEAKKKKLPNNGKRIPKCFLSKFFHLLVKGGDEVFPLYDQFAKKAAKRIINSVPESKDLRKRKRREDYQWHSQMVLAIAKEAGSGGKPENLRKLDHLLWLAGHYYEYKKQKEIAEKDSAWVVLFNHPESKSFKKSLENLEKFVGADL